MLRAALLCTALLACAPAHAQPYSGTYTAQNAQGGSVTLVLEQRANAVSGTLSGNNHVFRVQAELTPEGVLGTVSGNGTTLYMLAQLRGETLDVVLAEPGADGAPNLQAARQLAFARTAAGGPAAAPGRASDQLSQFLTRNAWCGFTYNQRSGTSTSERVVFHANGVVTQQSGRETYSSGPSGTVAGQYGGGKQGRWKVQDNVLHLSEDGFNWEPQPLQITQNSNGYPIIKSGGKEYMICN